MDIEIPILCGLHCRSLTLANIHTCLHKKQTCMHVNKQIRIHAYIVHTHTSSIGLHKGACYYVGLARHCLSHLYACSSDEWLPIDVTSIIQVHFNNLVYCDHRPVII